MNLQEEYSTSYHLFIASLAPTSLDENTTTTFSIYPNPCSGALHLQYAISDPSTGTGQVIRDSRIEVLDVSGRVMKSVEKIAGADQQSVDVSDLPAGMYFVKYVNGSNTGVRKLLIQ